MRYQAISLAGKRTTVGTSALSADFGASKLKIPQHPALKRLNAYAARVAAAGGPEAYYGTGGCEGPWGPKGQLWLASKGKRAAKARGIGRSDVLTYLAKLPRNELAELLGEMWGTLEVAS